jgi:hypothetical protein
MVHLFRHLVMVSRRLLSLEILAYIGEFVRHYNVRTQ